MDSEHTLDANLTPEMRKNLYGNAYLNMLWHYWVDKSLKKNFEDNQMAVELEILPGLGHGRGEKERVQAAQRFFKKYL